jgi:hypothetical protein
VSIGLHVSIAYVRMLTVAAPLGEIPGIVLEPAGPSASTAPTAADA